jgi:hypothetical protein
MLCTYIFNILMSLILLKRFGQLSKKLPNHMEAYVHCRVYKNSHSDYIFSQLNPVNSFTLIFFKIETIKVNASLRMTRKHMGSGDTGPLILNFGLRWSRVSVLRCPHLVMLYDKISYHIMLPSISRFSKRSQSFSLSVKTFQFASVYKYVCNQPRLANFSPKEIVCSKFLITNQNVMHRNVRIYTNITEI